MKKTAIMLATALAVSLSLPALATEMAAPKPTLVSDEITVQGTIVTIDFQNRTVDLKGPKGNVVTLEVDPSVTRFDAMKVGDVVTAHYVDMVAFEVQKPGTPAAPDTLAAGSQRDGVSHRTGGVGERA